MNKIEYYKTHPDKFCKEILNIDLLLYQTKLLKVMLKKNKIYKKTETLHQFPQLRGSAKCLHFIIMLN